MEQTKEANVMNEKISKEEKNLIRALVAFASTKGYFPNEYDIAQITDNYNGSHRDAVEEYLDTLKP